MCAYASTPNKEAVRRHWDRPVLEARAQQSGLLTYLGLPGPDIHDLSDWGDVLAKTRTAVEATGRTRRQRAEADAKISRLLLNVSVQRLGEGFELLIGDIEDVLLSGQDSRGRRPQIDRFDFVNLDFDGGFGFLAAGDMKRPKALRALLQRQRGHAFTLFLTVNVRDTLGSEVPGYLSGMFAQASTGEAALLQWRMSRPDGERVLKLQPIVVDFIREAAEGEGFSCFVFPLVTYEGHERARMLHFVFDLTPRSSLKGFSPQSMEEILELPIVEAVDGDLKISWSAPAKSLEPALRFLEPSIRDAILKESISD